MRIDQGLYRIVGPQFLYTANALYQKFEKIFPEMKLCGRVPKFCILHVSVNDLYFITPPILLYCGCGPIAGIYKSFTDTKMQNLGTWPRSFFPGNICFAFSVQCSTHTFCSLWIWRKRMPSSAGKCRSISLFLYPSCLKGVPQIYFIGGLECVGHSFAYVANFGIFERYLDSNPESCTSNEGQVRIHINGWFPFMYSQKWNCYFQNRITVQCSFFQFLHSYICERFIYFQDRSAYSAAGKYVDRSLEYINRSQTHEFGNWDQGRTIPRKGIHKWDFPCSVP